MNLRLLLTLTVALLSFVSLTAQIPSKAEDVSPLLIGEQFPDISLVSPDGVEHNISELAGDQPAVILVYRGGWCPYCNTHLSDIQESEPEIIELGYRIFAVSPDSPEKLAATTGKKNLNYTLLSDPDGRLIKELGIAFEAPGRYAGMLKKNSGGFNDGLLPVPATFVVNTKGIIAFEYINPDYKTRISSELLIAVLKNL